jgi:hypothetical protein
MHSLHPSTGDFDPTATLVAKSLVHISFALVLLVSIHVTSVLAADEPKSKDEKAVRVVPLLTSSPLMGIGAGAAISYLYDVGNTDSSKSQLSAGGQYSNTASYNIFVNNTSFMNNNSIISRTLTSLASINNEFPSDDTDIEYNTRTISIRQLLLFEVRKNIFAGGHVSYKDIRYQPGNVAGEDFLLDNGIIDETSGGLGLALAYDTRENRYFPSDASWVDLNIASNPSWLGALESYTNITLNARYYARGMNEGDVWAWQFYGQYASEKTPDSGLPTLSGKSLLRGFPAGQFRARNLTGGQSEYRYQIQNSKFRLTAFFGAAYLAGGSQGVDGNSREDDGWYSAGGVGMRYAIQQRTGVDVRLDLVTTSENEQSIYVMLNQAF